MHSCPFMFTFFLIEFIHCPLMDLSTLHIFMLKEEFSITDLMMGHLHMRAYDHAKEILFFSTTNRETFLSSK